MDGDRDQMRRFTFDGTDVRGQIVRLDATWDEVLRRHDYPDTVQRLLGEALAAAVLLSGSLKFDGSMILQAQSSGPVTLLVAQVTSELTLRGLARWRGPVAAGTLPDLLGEGRLVITVDPRRGRERYQSIVDIRGDDLAGALDRYFEQSEQLRTSLWLAANERRATGLLLQEMPAGRGPGRDPDAWNRLTTLAATVEDMELLELPAEAILRRLFHEETVRLQEPRPVTFRCGCSRERIGETLRALGRNEIMSLVDELGRVEVDCDFCNERYVFDAVDAEALFSATHASSGRHRH